MMRLLAYLVIAMPLGPVFAEGDGPHPPEAWATVFHNKQQQVWDELRKSDGVVTAKEVIAVSYEIGSHHDGDRQFATAWLLIQLRDDPIPKLRIMMAEKSAERRAFAVLVAGMLADARLGRDINRLVKDPSKLGEFPGDWLWDTVGDAANEAAGSLKQGGISKELIESAHAIGPWFQQGKLEAVEGF